MQSVSPQRRRVERAIFKVRQNPDLMMIGPILDRMTNDLIETRTGTPTMSTNGQNLKFNPRFVDECPEATLRWVIVHEAMHTMLYHPLRFTAMQKNSDEPLTEEVKDIGNKAMDEVVNWSIHGLNATRSGFLQEPPLEWGICKNPKYRDQKEWSFEKIFRDMMANRPPPPQPQPQGQGEQGEGESDGDDGQDGGEQGDGGQGDTGGGSQKPEQGEGDPDAGDDSQSGGGSPDTGEAGESDDDSDSEGGGGGEDDEEQDDSGSEGGDSESDDDSDEDGDEDSEGDDDSDESEDGDDESDESDEDGDEDEEEREAFSWGEVEAAPEDTEIEEEMQEIAEAVANGIFIAKAWGEGAGSALMQMLGDLQHEEIGDWEFLRQYLMAIFSPDKTWVRQNVVFHQHGFLPARKKGAGVVHCVFDVSGSMSVEELTACAANTAAFCEELSITTLKCAYVDWVVHDIDGLTWEEFDVAAGELPEFRVMGRGGTRFNPIFERIEEEGEEVTCLVYFTDGEGYCPCPAPDFPVIWATTNVPVLGFGQFHEFGETVTIKAVNAHHHWWMS